MASLPVSSATRVGPPHIHNRLRRLVAVKTNELFTDSVRAFLAGHGTQWIERQIGVRSALEVIRAGYTIEQRNRKAAEGYLEALAQHSGLAREWWQHHRAEAADVEAEVWADLEKPLLRERIARKAAGVALSLRRKLAPAALVGLLLAAEAMAPERASAADLREGTVQGATQREHRRTGRLSTILAALAAWARRVIAWVRRAA